MQIINYVLKNLLRSVRRRSSCRRVPLVLIYRYRINRILFRVHPLPLYTSSTSTLKQTPLKNPVENNLKNYYKYYQKSKPK